MLQFSIISKCALNLHIERSINERRYTANITAYCREKTTQCQIHGAPRRFHSENNAVDSEQTQSQPIKDRLKTSRKQIILFQGDIIVQSNKKLYEVIINYLEKQIADGVYNNNVRLPTEVSLAQIFNVSRITARRALDELALKGLIYRKQGSGSYVSENTKPEFSKNVFEASYASDNTVSLILPYGRLGGRFSEIVHSSSRFLEKRGYQLILHNSRTDPLVERDIILKLMKTSVGGIIFYPTKDRTNTDLLYQIWLENFPFVAIDKKIQDIPVFSVYSDNFTGSYNLTQKLIQNGHRNIACFYYIDLSDVFSIRQRFFGFCSALHDGGVPINYDYVINYYDSMAGEKSRESIILELLDKGVTAIVAENDYTALDIIDICNHLDIKIPEQLSIVGFDNVPQSEYINPSLTTAEQDFSAIGKSAAEAIIAQIEKQSFPKERVIPVKIIERKSVKKLM